MFEMAREFAKEKMLPHAAFWEEEKASHVLIDCFLSC